MDLVNYKSNINKESTDNSSNNINNIILSLFAVLLIFLLSKTNKDEVINKLKKLIPKDITSKLKKIPNYIIRYLLIFSANYLLITGSLKFLSIFIRDRINIDLDKNTQEFIYRMNKIKSDRYKKNLENLTEFLNSRDKTNYDIRFDNIILDAFKSGGADIDKLKNVFNGSDNKYISEILQMIFDICVGKLSFDRCRKELARHYHPDKNKDDKATLKFQLLITIFDEVISKIDLLPK